MKEIICPKYRPPDVLQLREVMKPYPIYDKVLMWAKMAGSNKESS
jgi:hypothetical protein